MSSIFFVGAVRQPVSEREAMPALLRDAGGQHIARRVEHDIVDRRGECTQLEFREAKREQEAIERRPVRREHQRLLAVAEPRFARAAERDDELPDLGADVRVLEADDARRIAEGRLADVRIVAHVRLSERLRDEKHVRATVIGETNAPNAHDRGLALGRGANVLPERMEGAVLESRALERSRRAE